MDVTDSSIPSGSSGGSDSNYYLRYVGPLLVYDMRKRIGFGPNSVVFHGKFGEKEVAVKRVDKADTCSAEEIAFAKLKTAHPNVVECLDIADEQYFRYITFLT